MDEFFQFFNPGDAREQFARLYTMLVGHLFLRYVLYAGLAFLVFSVVFRRYWREHKIQEAEPSRDDYRREIGYSVLTVLIFGFLGAVVFSDVLRPHTRIYLDVGKYGWPYLFLSVALMVLMHDAYFYWTHRLMHTRWLYRTFHSVHHRSTNPTPWAAFSFHPLEALVEGAIIFPIVFLIPSHPLALFLFMGCMTLFNVLGHVGYEFFPSWFTRHPPGRWLNTSTAHNRHHRDFRNHFTLYFRFWDVLCGTTSQEPDKAIPSTRR